MNFLIFGNCILPFCLSLLAFSLFILRESRKCLRANYIFKVDLWILFPTVCFKISSMKKNSFKRSLSRMKRVFMLQSKENCKGLSICKLPLGEKKEAHTDFKILYCVDVQSLHHASFYTNDEWARMALLH